MLLGQRIAVLWDWRGDGRRVQILKDGDSLFCVETDTQGNNWIEELESLDAALLRLEEVLR
jgi:hypothetical protein